MMFAALLAPVMAFQGGIDAGLVRPATVDVEEIDGRRWYSVRARNASMELVMARLAALSGRELEGFENLERSAVLTADLERRPIEQVLEFTLGSVGLAYELRRDSITVVPAVLPDDDPDIGLNTASAAWVRAATRFPEHPAAASARLAQGEIAELRGLPGAARDHYLTLVEDYPAAAVTPEAYLRAGRISARLEQWAEAARHFRTLANLDVPTEYHVTARLEWARALIEQGDPQTALHALRSIDDSHPPQDDTERTLRLLVRARALNARGKYMQALEELDLVDGDFDALGAREALEIRAVALEGVGLPDEAARVWLLFAQDAGPLSKGHALETAARLSLEAEDELACLFVVREAEDAGFADRLAPYELEARRRLGYDVPRSTRNNRAGRLEQAEAWLAEEDLERAAPILESLYLARGELEDADAARACVGWARCVDQTQGLEAAIRILTEARDGFASLETRSEIDRGAAALFERHELYGRAMDAYEGRYRP